MYEAGERKPMTSPEYLSTFNLAAVYFCVAVFGTRPPIDVQRIRFIGLHNVGHLFRQSVPQVEVSPVAK